MRAMLPALLVVALATAGFDRVQAEPRDAPQWMEGMVLLRLHDDASRAAYARRAVQAPGGRSRALGIAAVDVLAGELGAALEPEFPADAPPPVGSTAVDLASFYVVRLPAGTSAEDARARFAGLAEVRDAFRDAVTPVAAVPNDSAWASSWWFRQTSRRDIHAPEAWDVTTGDDSTLIAIIDTGILRGHPDLGGTDPGGFGRLWTNDAERFGLARFDDDGNGYVDDVWGWDFVHLPDTTGVKEGEDVKDPDNDPSDFAAHGTAVAGLAGALTDNGIGVAGLTWRGKLLALRIGWSMRLYPLGEVSMAYAAQAVRYATRAGATVIHCSFSTLEQLDLSSALDAARQAGIVVVYAAGNNGLPQSMARREEAISVGASDSYDGVPVFSNRNEYVDLVAPGVSVGTTALLHLGPDSLSQRTPSYAPTASGTSFAAPLVSAAVALLQAKRRAASEPRLDPMSVQLRVRETTDDIRAVNPGLTLSGNGRLNVERLLTGSQTSFAAAIGARAAGPAVAYRTATGGHRIAIVLDGASLVLLDGTTGAVVRAVTLPGPAAGALAAAWAPAGPALFVGTTNGWMAGLDGNGDPLTGWPQFAGNASSLAGGPALGDLDGDGVFEIVCGSFAGNLHAWRIDGSPMLFFPRPALASTTPVALGRLDDVAGAEIVSVHGNEVRAIRFDGSELAGWPATFLLQPGVPSIMALGTERVPSVVTSVGGVTYAIAADGTRRALPVVGPVTREEIAIADLDRDGADDFVVVEPSQLRVHAMREDGTEIAGWPHVDLIGPGASPVVGSLLPNGSTGVLFAVGSQLRGCDAAGGSLTRFPIPGAATSFPTITQADADDGAEVLAGTGFDGHWYAYDAGPQTAPVRPQPWATWRGHPSRTGSTLERPPLSIGPALPSVTDLVAATRSTSIADLSWTVPAMPVGAGVVSCEVRRAPFPLDDNNFLRGREVATVTALNPGTRQTLVASLLEEERTHWFALRFRAGEENAGAVSAPDSAQLPGVAPGPVLGLAQESATTSSVTLRWIAPGDDGASGRATRYELRRSRAPLDSSNFTAGTLVPIPAPRSGGSIEHTTLGSLHEGETLHVALRAIDEAGHAGPLSADLEARLPVVPPGAITNLQIELRAFGNWWLLWTTSGDDGAIGQATRYDVRRSLDPIDESNFDTAEALPAVPAPTVSGSEQGMPLPEVVEGRTTWFAMRVYDAAGNASPLSNIATLALPPTRPAAISNLAVAGRGPGLLQLTWVATGDDSLAGRATRFDLRRAGSPIDSASFEVATPLQAPAPQVPGTLQGLTDSDVIDGVEYWYALRVVDDIGLVSALSNVAYAAPANFSPRPVTNLAVVNTGTSVTLQWTAPMDDLPTRPANRYDLRASTQPLDNNNFTAAMGFVGLPAPAAPGTGQQFTAQGVHEGVRVYFALRSVDSSNQWSALSNLVEAVTTAVAPAGLRELRVAEAGADSVRLEWIAPGDDSLSGRPFEYDLSLAVRLPDALEFAPGHRRVTRARVGADSVDRVWVRTPTQGVTVWAALRARDESGNAGPGAAIVLPSPQGGVQATPGIVPVRQPSPSPFGLRWSALAGTPARLELLDVAGRRVLVVDLGPDGAGEYQWNGRDEAGRPVPAGLYFARLDCGSVHTRTRVVLLP